LPLSLPAFSTRTFGVPAKGAIQMLAALGFSGVYRLDTIARIIKQFIML